MKIKKLRLSKINIAILSAFGTITVQHAVAAEDNKTLPAVTVTEGKDTRTIPLDLPAGTASRLGIPIKEIPASVEIIDRTVIEQRGDKTVLQATEKAAGFTSTYTGGTPGSFSVRGFTNNSVAWLYDGIRVPGGTGMSARPMDTANLDRIEVLRGPASVLHGEGAIGAAVNLISRQPSFAKQPIELDYGYSSFNSHRFHTGTGGAIKDDVAAYRFDFSTNHFGSYVHDERGQLDRITGSVLFKLSNDLNLTLSVDHMEDDVDNFYWGTPLVNGQLNESLRRVNYNNLNDDRFESKTTWLRANIEWKPSNQFEIRNQLYYYDSYRNWRETENYSFNAGVTPTVTRSSWGDLDHAQDLIGNRFEILHKGKIANLENRALFGVDANRTTFQTKRNGFPGSQVVDAYNPPSVDFMSVAGLTKSLARDVHINQWSAFAEDQLSLTKALKLVVGARHDRFSSRWLYYDQAGVPLESKSHSFNSWRGGLVYDLTPDLTMYASYATAVEPGNTLLLLNRNQTQLDLTTAKQAEVGIKHSFWSNKAEWTAAMYDIKKKNLFVPDPALPTNRIPVGKQSSQGVELSLGIRPTQQWQIDANIARVDASYDEYSTGTPPISRNGNIPPFVPKWIANLGVQYMPTEKLSFGAWGRHVDDVYVDDANTTKLPSYTTLDLSAGYKFDKRTELTFRIRNATDKFYATSTYNGTGQALIADPRTYELSISMKF